MYNVNPLDIVTVSATFMTWLKCVLLPVVADLCA